MCWEVSGFCQKVGADICFSIASISRRRCGASKKTPELGRALLQVLEFSFEFFNHVFSLELSWIVSY
jgi:hypothetical protein